MSSSLAIDDAGSPVLVAEVGLAAHPEWVLAIWCAWAGIGALVAAGQSKRGHDVRSLMALGLVLGPLLHAYGRTALASIEGESEPVVVRHRSADLDGSPVLVVADQDPDAAVDALPALRLVASDSPVTVVMLVRHDVVRDRGGHDRAMAVRRIETAGLFLHEFDPELVLVPGGGPDAIDDHASRIGASAVIVVGSGIGYRGLGAGRSGRAAILVDGSPSPLERLR